jgi:hypothetical protein
MRLRELAPAANAIVGIDLAGKKQTVLVTDHDSKVLARKRFRCRVWDLGAALDWAVGRGGSQGLPPALTSATWALASGLKPFFPAVGTFSLSCPWFSGGCGFTRRPPVR